MGGRACRGRELTAGKDDSSEAECRRNGDSRIGAATTSREEVSTDFFYCFSNTSDCAIDNGPFGWARSMWGIYPRYPQDKTWAAPKGGPAHKIKACTAMLQENVIYCIIPNRIFFL